MCHARRILTQDTTRGGMAADASQVRCQREIGKLAIHAVETTGKTEPGLNPYRDGRKREPFIQRLVPRLVLIRDRQGVLTPYDGALICDTYSLPGGVGYWETAEAGEAKRARR